jgi:hypothetical protein
MYFKKIVYGGNEVCALVMLQRSWHYCSWWCLGCCCLHTCADGHSTTILIANFVNGFLLKWCSQSSLASILYLKIWDLIWHQLDLNLKYFLFLKFDSGACFECIIYLWKIVLFVNRNVAHERYVKVFKIIWIRQQWKILYWFGKFQVLLHLKCIYTSCGC